MTMWSIYIKKSRARLILISAMSIIMFASCTINTNEIKTISSGGTVYRGQTHNGKREGLGMLYQGDSVLYSGMWHNGMRQGRGTVRDHDGKLIDGVWDHDTRHGNPSRLNGCLRRRDGREVSRQWLWQVYR